MWGRQLLLAIIGVSSGATIAAGVFGFIIGLGVVSDLADRTHTGNAVNFYEDCMTMGGVVGTLVLLYEPRFSGNVIWLLILGAVGGIFTGCLVMSLGETLNVFPIFFRRSKIVQGIPYLILALALGKTVGSLIQLLNGW